MYFRSAILSITTTNTSFTTPPPWLPLPTLLTHLVVLHFQRHAALPSSVQHPLHGVHRVHVRLVPTQLVEHKQRVLVVLQRIHGVAEKRPNLTEGVVDGWESYLVVLWNLNIYTSITTTLFLYIYLGKYIFISTG